MKFCRYHCAIDKTTLCFDEVTYVPRYLQRYLKICPTVFHLFKYSNGTTFLEFGLVPSSTLNSSPSVCRGDSHDKQSLLQKSIHYCCICFFTYFNNLQAKVENLTRNIENSKKLVAPWCNGYHCCTTSFNKGWLKFCAGSNPAHSVSEIRYGEDLWQ